MCYILATLFGVLVKGFISIYSYQILKDKRRLSVIFSLSVIFRLRARSTSIGDILGKVFARTKVLEEFIPSSIRLVLGK